MTQTPTEEITAVDGGYMTDDEERDFLGDGPGEWRTTNPTAEELFDVSHATVRVLGDDGEYHHVLACEIEDGDINDDGSVSTPVSGECDCEWSERP